MHKPSNCFFHFFSLLALTCPLVVACAHQSTQNTTSTHSPAENITTETTLAPQPCACQEKSTPSPAAPPETQALEEAPVEPQSHTDAQPALKEHAQTPQAPSAEQRPTPEETLVEPQPHTDTQPALKEHAQTPQAPSAEQRPTPERCHYSSYYWSSTKRQAVDHYKVDKAYGDLTTDEKSPDDPRCTPCVEDQVTIDPRALGINAEPFRVCYIYADAMSQALQEIKASASFEIKSLTAYRVGKTRGKIVDGKRTEWSNHSFGTAIDINAEHNGLYNRCNTSIGSKTSDVAKCKLGMGGAWDPDKRPKHTITSDGVVVKAMGKFWKWGGSIPGDLKDIMHFSITGY